MSIKIVVLAKQVPDTRNVGPEAMTPEGTINRSALPAVYNPEDLNALEMALRVKEMMPGSTITVVTMGPPRAEEIIREAIYRGADDGFVLSDRRFAGADTLATSYAISCAVKKLGHVDLVFGGRQAIDGDTAQVGPQVAEKMDIPQITYAEELLEVNEKCIRIKRRISNGTEVVESPLPVLVTVCGSAPRPRFRHAHLVLQNRHLQIPVWTADDVNPDFDRLGLSGSPTKVKNVDSVVLTQKDNVRVENNQESLNSLISNLVTNHIIG